MEERSLLRDSLRGWRANLAKHLPPHSGKNFTALFITYNFYLTEKPNLTILLM
jgi:hypothetical protein